ncbi:branched-chain amino acid aminotransferase [Albimonas sp. CAU 1670]|uniref:branched-chain amino acid aminotransferase n=1 Tax=Albimonas sp. CAU 1670 TaxID=3032599 RepID=UPI0023D9B3C1|nr:branched-chain amino acid aminotransferase [Albimonas sp. CAU 1670]MDF2235537.1 branched-chain amino acid aminotransferase [Albimonas sp. CAU 1670]
MGAGEIWTWSEGSWHQGDVRVAGAADHGLWQGASVFDGARGFEGVAPDLDLHCARVNASARAMGLEATVPTGEMIELATEGLGKFASDGPVYIRPMYWSRSGDASLISADPESTVFALCLEALPMTDPATLPNGGLALTTTQFRRPIQAVAVMDAKAGCLYPNNARMVREAKSKGFDNALVQDLNGNVAELATSNVFLVKDGVVATPIPNGTFLNGITRQRVIKLLRGAGMEVVETTLTLDDFRAADEVFSTGNANKVVPCWKFEDVEYGPGPVAKRARELYWEFAHA